MPTEKQSRSFYPDEKSGEARPNNLMGDCNSIVLEKSKFDFHVSAKVSYGNLKLT
jgi:hypothetical protein